MMRKFFIAAVLLLLTVPAAADLKTGFSLAVMESVTGVQDVTVITGWSAHTGGGAVTQLKAYIDCDPRVAACAAFGNVVIIPRPDVVNLLFPYGVDAPDWCGFIFTGPGWTALASGLHTVYLAWTDSERGRQQWFYGVLTFTK